MDNAKTPAILQNTSGGDLKSRFLITTPQEQYQMYFESIIRGYYYCLKRYPYQDFEIESLDNIESIQNYA